MKHWIPSPFFSQYNCQYIVQRGWELWFSMKNWIPSPFFSQYLCQYVGHHVDFLLDSPWKIEYHLPSFPNTNCQYVVQSGCELWFSMNSIPLLFSLNTTINTVCCSGCGNFDSPFSMNNSRNGPLVYPIPPSVCYSKGWKFGLPWRISVTAAFLSQYHYQYVVSKRWFLSSGMYSAAPFYTRSCGQRVMSCSRHRQCKQRRSSCRILP